MLHQGYGYENVPLLLSLPGYPESWFSFVEVKVPDPQRGDFRHSQTSPQCQIQGHPKSWPGGAAVFQIPLCLLSMVRLSSVTSGAVMYLVRSNVHFRLKFRMSGKPPFFAGMVGDITENIFHIAGLISQELIKPRNILADFTHLFPL